MKRSIFVLVGTMVLTLSFLASPARAQDAPGASTLTVHAVVCPVGYTGSNFVDDCAGEEGLSVIVSLDASEFAVDGATDEDGSVTFTDLGDGSYTVTLDVPGDVNNFVTYCSAPGEIEPRQIRNRDTNQIGVDISNEVEMLCSFYVKPIDARGDVGPTSLPDTGVGAGHPLGGLSYLACAAGLGALAGGVALRRKRA